MWCVVGLGNPGPRYGESRHNVGFMFIDRFCAVSAIRIDRRAPHIAWGAGLWCQQRLLVARPRTFMNQSGLALRSLLQRQTWDLSKLLVVHDDMDLALGRLRFKQRGGDGGHRGIRSIMNALEEDCFLRLRIGIGRPPPGAEAEHYVLEPFGKDQREAMDGAIDRAVEAVRTLIQEGLGQAMNLYHSALDPGTER